MGGEEVGRWRGEEVMWCGGSGIGAHETLFVLVFWADIRGYKEIDPYQLLYYTIPYLYTTFIQEPLYIPIEYRRTAIHSN